MTNELSSFDEFNGISSCLHNTIRFLSQQSKKMKTSIRFLSQLSKKCSTSVTMLTSEKLISTPDREKINLLYLHCRPHFIMVILVKTLYNNVYCHMLKGTP
jgi:hypothetical protein